MEVYIGCWMTTDWFEKDNRKIRFSEQTLEDQMQKINKEAHIPFGLDHNPLLMPIGRSDRAWLERTQDNVTLMVEHFVCLDADPQEHSKSGTKIINLQIGKSNRGFAKQQKKDDGVEICVDPSDFENPESWDAFVRKMASADRAVTVREYTRNSVDPDGIILISLATWAAIRLEKFARHIVDETLRKVGDKVSDRLSELIIETIGAFEKTASATMKRYHLIVVFPGNPELVLISERMAGEVGNPVDHLDSKEIGQVIAGYGDLLVEAQEVTLVKDYDNAWKFQHIKTTDGNIVGDWNCYQASIERWIELRNIHGQVPVSPAGKPDD